MASSAAQQLALQMTAKWPKPECFILMNVKVRAVSTAIIAQLI